jgi:hypothetical protein
MRVPAFVLAFLLTALLVTVGCRSGDSRQSMYPPVYVGSVSVRLYDQLGPKAKAVATATYGEEARILDRRRNFFLIRTDSGAEGWTHMRQLMAQQDMDDLRELADYAAEMPSQGAATVYEPLNVHNEPHRLAPSIAQIQKGQKVHVLARLVNERGPYEPRPIVPATPRKAPVARKKKAPKRAKTSIEPLTPAPPALTAPAPPHNWIELSGPGDPDPIFDEQSEMREALAAETLKKSRRRIAEPPAVQQDDWALVRLDDGSAGWVLYSRLLMGIPDQVAQYAEGHRIMAYFSLGEVSDGEQTKHHWLWTTASRPALDVDFDGFRVFIYAQGRRRYETAYIERNVRGHFPVRVQEVEVQEGRKAPERARGFTLIIEDPATGEKVQKTYAFQGYRVRVVDRQPWQPADPAPWEYERSPEPETPEQQAESMLAKAKDRVKKWLGR